MNTYDMKSSEPKIITCTMFYIYYCPCSVNHLMKTVKRKILDRSNLENLMTQLVLRLLWYI